jgi:hypothetical protein
MAWLAAAPCQGQGQRQTLLRTRRQGERHRVERVQGLCGPVWAIWEQYGEHCVRAGD